MSGQLRSLRPLSRDQCFMSGRTSLFRIAATRSDPAPGHAREGHTTIQRAYAHETVKGEQHYNLGEVIF